MKAKRHMDSRNSEYLNNLKVESIRISYQGIRAGKQAASLHDKMYKQINLKINPPERIPDKIAKLGVAEILITITLAPIFHYAITSIIKVLRDFIRDRKNKSCKGQIIIKVDDSDLGRRFPFSTREINLEEFFMIIDEYIKDLRKKSLSELIEMRTKINEEIKKLFETKATFLDIDVISTEQLLQEKEDLTAIAYSMEQYHKFVKERAEQNQGTILDIVGCEIMAWFASANDAVNCARDILKDKENFNMNKNKLNCPFQFRIGINTGLALIDEKKGKVFCRTPLDIARKVRKVTEPGTFSVSEHTFRKLENKNIFVKNKYIESDGIWSYAFKVLHVRLS
ncbi:MAG: hypothetical protein ACFFCW_20840 [Candidatus Hodarchaeota archaeon]